MKWLMRGLIGMLVLFLAFLLIPLAYVEFTVPKAYRSVDENSVLGRASRISDLAIIENYRKEGRRVAVVQKPIVFIDEGLNGAQDRFLVVTRGYKTDFASLPWLARLFYNPFDEYAEAAIIHDWLYAIGEPGKKREADLIFLRAMLDDGVSPVLARYFYVAVRFGTLFGNGGYAYEAEWEEGFFSTVLEDDLPGACVIDRPDKAFLQTQDFLSSPSDKFDEHNALAAAYIQGYDPYLKQWYAKLSSDACQGSIKTGLQDRVANRFEPILAQYSAEERLLAQDLIEWFSMMGDMNENWQRSDVYKPYLIATLKEKYGLTPPDTFWCLQIKDQIKALALMTFHEKGRTDWPVMTCSNVDTGSDASESTPAPENAVCVGESYREFDFWLGEWDVTQENGEPAGTNTISLEENGCLIRENWASVQGITGQSQSFYNPGTDEWRQVWVGAGSIIDIKGGLTPEGAMRLEGEITYTEDGSTYPFFGEWTLQQDGKVIQHFEQFDPEEKVWEEWFTGIYARSEN